ncbi:pyridoxal phosphate-dependent aminotransferase [Planomonospora parontospora]|uniref:pyridoxal phosphate-dependent aminotransferase n=1 Tax=Planomonospora parontospora TaxID=58119 RepID=UPI0016712DE3|nr:pyridoxal phosphate-dependent aminotransferase [Planomonospora parontospora]GGL46072.1 aminopeptidase [Planomonospora parontospora subsp. antibiotica]GII16215.1 aminopeptidase [Planomonospora parontospora subsp. antibiotica]
MNITLSATLAANEEIDRRRRAGHRVLNLAFGEAGLPVHPALRERLSAAAGQNGYGPVAGAAALREAAAGYWTRRRLPTDPGLVVCGPGSKPLLYGLLLAIGGDIVLPVPSWVSYAAQAELAGVRSLPVPALPGGGGAPDPERVVSAVLRARAAGRDVRSLLVTLPDNPSGTLAGADVIKQLAEVARELDLLIVSDEIYRDLVHDPDAGFLSPAEAAPERTVVTSGLSKSLALGGWRIGVTRLPSAGLRDRLLAVASEIWSSPAAPVQQAAAYAYTEPPELVERIGGSRRLHAAVARAVHARLTAAGVRTAAPQGGFYLYPDFTGRLDPAGAGRDVSTSAGLAALLLDAYGVGVLPGHAFGDDPAALRVRMATSLLYGETTEQRLAALSAPDPLALPWIAASLDHLGGALDGLVARRSTR